MDVAIDNRITKCRKILETDPNSQIFASLAEAYRKKGDLEQAFRVCQNGLRVHPSYGAAHLVMAKINLDRGLYDWAEVEVGKARQMAGNNRTIELLLAEIYIYKGEYQAAIKLLKKLSTVDPQNDHVRRLLEIALKIPKEQAEEIGDPVSEPVTETVPENSSPSEQLVEEPVAPLSITEMLKEASTMESVQGALFINVEGLVIESQWRSEMDATVCGAALAEVNKFLMRELMNVNFGEVDTVLIETANQVFYLIHVATGMYLLVAKADVNLGTLRMRMTRLLQQVVSS